MNQQDAAVKAPPTKGDFDWRAAVSPYQSPDVRRSIFQLCNTLIPFAGLLVGMYFTLDVSYWLTLLLAVPAAGFLVRTFIIMHDCGHGSFFPSRRWNDVVGFVTGVLTLTPYVQWRHDHAVHHASSGNLDKRGHGDITTLTVKEYLELNWLGRVRYLTGRMPIVMFGLGPFWLAFKQRFQAMGPDAGWKERISVQGTNLALVILVTGFSLLIGLEAVVKVYLPVFFLSGAAGIWLFYVQHQFDDAYWAPRSEWSYATAAVEGSSYFKLSKPLQWFTGNIGFHHVHHLNPRIPNYRLERCHSETDLFQNVKTLTLWDSVKTFRLRLWDEEHGRMVSFRELRRMMRERSAA
ncbi:MAG: fatty acid desaturase [Gemmatimonadota bacterium]